MLNTRSGIYHLDIYLPFNLNQEECGAQFDKKNKLLTITMPVVSKNWSTFRFLDYSKLTLFTVLKKYQTSYKSHFLKDQSQDKIFHCFIYNSVRIF